MANPHLEKGKSMTQTHGEQWQKIISSEISCLMGLLKTLKP